MQAKGRPIAALYVLSNCHEQRSQLATVGLVWIVISNAKGSSGPGFRSVIAACALPYN